MSDLLIHLPEWHLQAACAGIQNPDVFFSHGNSAEYEAALALCERCPVREQCRQDAIQHNMQGIWGGTTRPERRAVKERRAYTPPGGPFGQAVVNAAKTHCKWGHEFTPENTRMSHGKRSCIACYRRRLEDKKTARKRKAVTA